MTRILLVEDEKSFSEPLSFALSRDGFDVDVAENGTQALEVFESNGADLVLLDLMLPGMSGVDVCKSLRKTSDVPVIMVTAKDAEIDKVVGLEIGADDYVTKPYSYRELTARINAVLRRHQATQDSDTDMLNAGEIEMNTARHEVMVRGEIIALPLKEYDLLEIFLRNPDRVLTRELLIDRVWGPDYVGDTKTLDVHIKRLREKLEEDRGAPALLQTVRGVGYRLSTQLAQSN